MGELVSDLEEGGVYEGTVVAVKDFGAVVELLRNKGGLLHVSEITDSADRHPGGNIGLVKDHLKVGDKIEVLCTKIDHVQGSIRLSRKKLLQKESLVRNAEETISIGNFPSFSDEENKVGMEVQDMLMVDSGLGDAGHKENVDTEVEGIGQLISSGEEPDDDFSSDGNTNDDLTGYDTTMVYNEVSLDDCASEHMKTKASNMSLGDRWMERYNELKQFNRANGNCDVPTKPTGLGSWVHYQRARYKKGLLSDDRMQLLNDLGFTWSVADRNEEIW